MKWICCQLGAREHYAIPRALRRSASLECLITDTWVPRGHPLGAIKPALRQRFHPELRDADLYSANVGSISFELRAKLAGKQGWPLVMARNERFQRIAIGHLQSLPSALCPLSSDVTLFAYSYAARELFRYARSRGWRTVLGQIDPGLHEEKLVTKLFDESGGQLGEWQPAPTEYWRDWREECELADHIVVNSEWAREGLIAEEIPSEKLRVIPLAFESDAPVRDFRREYPDQFTPERPLRVLFLGQINLRKGARPLFEAARQLSDAPLEFWFVGPLQVRVPENLSNSRVRWFGSVSRHETARFYRESDVFLFPTLSDGFGLTQLEAQSWKLPIIASRFCGEVVHDGQNGLLLQEVTAAEIVKALLECWRSPQKLKNMSEQAVDIHRFSLDALARHLLTL